MKRERGIRQHDVTDCAVACIAYIASGYGLQLPLITIREACGASKAGTTLKGIVEACEKIGMDAEPLKSSEKDINALEDIELPAILHVMNDQGDLHFVVLCKISDKGYEIMDPADGKHHTLTEEKISGWWSGYLVTVCPGTSFKPENKVKSVTGRLMAIILSNYGSLFISLLLAIVYIATGISSSIFIQQIIDNVLPTGDRNLLSLIGIAMGAFVAVSAMSGLAQTLLTLKVGVNIDHRLITDYIEHLFKLPVGFFAIRGSVELNSRITDAMKIRSFITDGIISVVISILTLCVSFALMFTYYWKLALFTLMFLPVYIVIFAISDKVNNRVNREIIENSASFEEKTVEGISAIRGIKYSNMENAVKNGIISQFLQLLSKMYKGGKVSGIFTTSTDVVSRLLTLMLLTVGSYFVFRNELTIGELVSFYAISSYFSIPLGEIVGINGRMTEAKVSAQRLFEIMDAETEDYSGSDVGLDRCRDIVFKNVSFSYPGQKTLFKNLNVTFPAGKITAIVGESGCGKSTVASLLMRGYKPQEGSITIGGIDISAIALKKWRKYAAMVPQETPLLNCTLLENICGMEKKPDIERVAEIIKDLGMEEFISSLPMGLATRAGEGGCLLSGGQRQRIFLAKALYRAPKVLILDEATSSLDNNTQNDILNAIIRLKDKGLSVIMITHKKETAEISDNIIDLSAHSGCKSCPQ